MTLAEVIKALEGIAIMQPGVNKIISSGDIYDLNEDRDAKYAVFCATQGTHSYNYETGENTYNFTLFYVDRLSSDESNKIDIQSTALEVLKNILRTFSQEYDEVIPTSDFEVFTERFAAHCAGAYTTVSINTFDNNCIDIF